MDDIQYLGTSKPNESPKTVPERPVSGLILFVDGVEDPSVSETRSRVFFKAIASSVEIGRGTSSEKRESSAGACGDQKSRFLCPVMSRRHARIHFLDNGTVTLTDLDSHHGTFVKSPSAVPAEKDGPSARVEPETPHILNDGEIVTFGKAVYRDNKWHSPITVRVKFLYSHRSTWNPVTPTKEPGEVMNRGSESSKGESSSASSNRYRFCSSVSCSSSEADSDSDSVQEITPPPTSTCRAPDLFRSCWPSTRLGENNSLPLPSLRRLGLLANMFTPSFPSSGNDARDDTQQLGSPSQSSDCSNSLFGNQLAMQPESDQERQSSPNEANEDDAAHSECSSQMQISSRSVSPAFSRDTSPEPAIIGAWPGSPVLSSVECGLPDPENIHEASGPNSMEIPESSGGDEPQISCSSMNAMDQLSLLLPPLPFEVPTVENRSMLGGTVDGFGPGPILPALALPNPPPPAPTDLLNGNRPTLSKDGFMEIEPPERPFRPNPGLNLNFLPRFGPDGCIAPHDTFITGVPRMVEDNQERLRVAAENSILRQRQFRLRRAELCRVNPTLNSIARMHAPPVVRDETYDEILQEVRHLKEIVEGVKQRDTESAQAATRAPNNEEVVALQNDIKELTSKLSLLLEAEAERQLQLKLALPPQTAVAETLVEVSDSKKRKRGGDDSEGVDVDQVKRARTATKVITNVASTAGLVSVGAIGAWAALAFL